MFFRPIFFLHFVKILILIVMYDFFPPPFVNRLGNIRGHCKVRFEDSRIFLGRLRFRFVFDELYIVKICISYCKLRIITIIIIIIIVYENINDY